MLAPFNEAASIIEKGKKARVTVTAANTGTISMLRQWRAWMNQIAIYLNERGRYMPLYINERGEPKGKRPMNGEDCHQVYTHLALGCDDDGVRLSWAMSESGSNGKRVATTGQRLRAMDKIWHWAMDEGIPLSNPQNSEYRKLTDETNA